jgi:hypothetical protein
LTTVGLSTDACGEVDIAAMQIIALGDRFAGMKANADPEVGVSTFRLLRAKLVLDLDAAINGLSRGIKYHKKTVASPLHYSTSTAMELLAEDAVMCAAQRLRLDIAQAVAQLGRADEVCE